jgi:hypothetical protein
VPNSPANPLPTAICSPKFRCWQIGQIVLKTLIYNRVLTLRRPIPGAEGHFFPALRERQRKISCRPTPSRVVVVPSSDASLRLRIGSTER